MSADAGSLLDMCTKNFDAVRWQFDSWMAKFERKFRLPFLAARLLHSQVLFNTLSDLSMQRIKAKSLLEDTAVRVSRESASTVLAVNLKRWDNVGQHFDILLTEWVTLRTLLPIELKPCVDEAIALALYLVVGQAVGARALKTAFIDVFYGNHDCNSLCTPMTEHPTIHLLHSRLTSPYVIFDRFSQEGDSTIWAEEGFLWRLSVLCYLVYASFAILDNEPKVLVQKEVLLRGGYESITLGQIRHTLKFFRVAKKIEDALTLVSPELDMPKGMEVSQGVTESQIGLVAELLPDIRTVLNSISERDENSQQLGIELVLKMRQLTVVLDAQ